jgi:myosin heavy subunit
VLLPEKEIDGYEMNDQKHDGVDDCAQMPYLSEASVLHNLKIRYDCDCIYVCFAFSVFSPYSCSIA